MPRRKILSSKTIFSFVFLSSVSLATVGSGSTSKPTPVWNASFAEDPDWIEANRTIDTNGYGPPEVEFVGDDKVVVSFLHSIHERPPEGQPGFMEPLCLKALFFDARTGRSLTTLRWRARREDAKVLPVYDGGFVVRARDVLLRYSRDLQLQRERALPGTTAVRWHRPTWWQVDMAPGGTSCSFDIL